METNDNDYFEQVKRNEDLLCDTSPNLSSDWRVNCSNMSSMSHTNLNRVAIYNGTPMEASSSSTPPMVDTLCTTIWDHPMISPNFGFYNVNNSHNASTNSNTMGTRNGNVGWAPPMAKGNMFVPSESGLISQDLSEFPADSGFIERAAKFSCFGRGTFSDLINPYGILDCANPYARSSTTMMQRPQGVLAGSDLKSSQNVVGSVSKSVSYLVEQSERSPVKNEGKSNRFGQSRDKAKPGSVLSDKESDEAEFSGRCSVDREPSSKALGSKKRKRDYQGNKFDKNRDVLQPPDDSTKDDNNAQPKGDQKPTSTNKFNEKHGKQVFQASDSPKEEYMHVRAQRGQATNSHSLAERVRREKISERMKCLQDLVPGCSKVTGKSVMLDEIINYVQSLQRQVEFLSMKLATVDPHLEFDLEAVLSKEIRWHIAGPSSLGYSPDMSTMLFLPVHPSQPGLIQPFLPGVGTSSDSLQRSISGLLIGTSEGYKQPQVPNMWVEDELHNVVKMGFNSSAPLDITQDINGSSSQSQMKVEL